MKALIKLYQAFMIDKALRVVLERKLGNLRDEKIQLWLYAFREYLMEEYPKSKIFRPLDMFIFTPLRIISLLGFTAVVAFGLYCLVLNKDYLVNTAYFLGHPVADWFLIVMALVLTTFLVIQPLQYFILVLIGHFKIIKKYPELKKY